MIRLLVVVVAFVLLVQLTGWRSRRPAVGNRERPLNVLLITIDTLRADAISAYGRPGTITPTIDRLAAAGARFENAHAHNVMTLPSHANILSGRLPIDHGVRDNGGFRFPDATETLATLLKARGYRTGAFISAFPLESRFGLARGFDVYDDSFADAAPRPAFLIQERGGAETVGLATRWIESSTGGPWFCWVHLYEPHFPYEPDEPFAMRHVGNPYLGEVAAADAAVSQLVDPLLAAGRDGRTLVVVTADHGEALGEHGEATHGVFAYESALKVPLVIYQPRLFSPTVVTSPARHVDLLPTVLDALSLPVPNGLAGESLLPIVAGARQTAAPTYFEALSASFNRRWAPLVGVIQDRTKYIDLPIPELYDLQVDPREEHNLAAAQPQRVDDMRRVLAQLRSGDRGSRPQPESIDTRARLRSLGYAGGGSAPPRARHTEEDDPKNLIVLDELLQAVVGLYLAGDVHGALTRCRELVHRRPDMPVALVHLAILEREAGHLPEAVDALRQVVALSPEDTEAVSLLGSYLTQAGRAREAADVLEPYAARPDADVEVLTTRALALARLGRPRDALATLAAARERDPSNAMTVVEVGTVHLMAGNRDHARRAFEEALAINPQAARAHSSLGVLDLEEGRSDQAFAHWRLATSVDPREHEKILTLGIALDREGRTAQARACFEFFVESAPASRYRREIDRARLWLKRESESDRTRGGRGDQGGHYEGTSHRLRPIACAVSPRQTI